MPTHARQRIILPGGAGLVGQNLVPRLRAAGYEDIVVLDKHRANLEIARMLHPGIIVEYADLSEPGPWERYFSQDSIVVMLQAQIGGTDRDVFVRNNVTTAEVVLDAVKRHGISHLVHVSSSVVKSKADDFYTDTKKLQEEMVLASGVPSVVLRPTLMFGWFDRKHLGWLSRFMKRTPVFPIPGDGRYMRQPLYAGDFANIIISCIQNRTQGEVYNISGQEEIDYIDIIRSIKDVTGARALILPIPYGLFYGLLWCRERFDRNPPFTTQQLQALRARDTFEVIDWPRIFGVRSTPFREAINETFNDPRFGGVVLEF
jgi:nucleoside-diphosphate-sugar epimerase